VHLSIFISVINRLDAKNVCFTVSLFHASTCFEHMCSKHVEAWNKLVVKQTFCASSWLITEINIYSNALDHLKYFTLPDRKHQIHLNVLIMFDFVSNFMFFLWFFWSSRSHADSRESFYVQSVSPCSVWVLHTKIVLSLDTRLILILSVEYLVYY